jgi:hypothetical protein
MIAKVKALGETALCYLRSFIVLIVFGSFNFE